MNKRLDFDKTIEELALQVPFKDVTDVGEIVVVVKETEPGRCTVTFAQVLKFTLEMRDKKEWWHVDLVYLTLPLLFGTLILKSEGLTKMETFTSGGKKMFIKAINTAPILENKPAYKRQKTSSNPTKQSIAHKVAPVITLVK
ncbi:MAG: hypothetical protein LBT62_02660 [Deltaproteobacteria bacterium]|jgi:hypothetical protein|nr:hypothetical protein [Deltaproteobacteria bacterium]